MRQYLTASILAAAIAGVPLTMPLVLMAQATQPAAGAQAAAPPQSRKCRSRVSF